MSKKYSTVSLITKCPYEVSYTHKLAILRDVVEGESYFKSVFRVRTFFVSNKFPNSSSTFVIFAWLFPQAEKYKLNVFTVADPRFACGGTSSPDGCTNILFCKTFAENCLKMKDFGPRGHASITHTHLGSTTDLSLQTELSNQVKNRTGITEILLFSQIFTNHWHFFSMWSLSLRNMCKETTVKYIFYYLK